MRSLGSHIERAEVSETVGATFTELWISPDPDPEPDVDDGPALAEIQRVVDV